MPFYGQVVQDKLQTWLDIPVLANQQNIKNPALLVLEELYIYIVWSLEFRVTSLAWCQVTALLQACLRLNNAFVAVAGCSDVIQWPDRNCA